MSTGSVPQDVGFFIGVLFCIIATSQGQLQLQDIRLQDGTTPYEGRVEVKYNNTWGTVCTDGFEDVEAMVICRQLGHGKGTAVTDSRFGPGSGKIWLDNLACDGTEESVNICPANNLGVHNCDHSSDAGVMCENPSAVTPAPTTTRAPATAQPSNCSSGGNTSPNVRIIGPSNKNGVGFVEVNVDGQWGAVCDDHWDIMDARVVCGILCFNQSLALAGASQDIDYVKSNVSTTFLLDDVDCIGTETDLFACSHADVGKHNCQAGELASVTCVPINHTGAEAPLPLLSCMDEKFTASFSRDYDPYLQHRHLTIYKPTSDPCSIQFHNNSAYIIMSIPFTDCGTQISTNQTHIFYTNTIHYNFTTRLGSITRKNSYLVEVKCEFARNQSNDNGGFTPVTQLVTQSAPGTFSVGMSLFADDNFAQPLTENPQLTLNQPLSVSLVLNATLPGLKLVPRTCFATPSGDWTDQVNHFLFENNCPNDTTVALVPLNDTAAGFRFRVFRFIGFANVFLHCTSTVCEVSEKTDICDRSCGTTPTSNPNGRRRRSSRQGHRRRRSDSHMMFYSTSHRLIVKNAKDNTVIERLPPEVPSTTPTVFTTPRPTSISTAFIVSTARPSGSSVRVHVTTDSPATDRPITDSPTTDSPTTHRPTTDRPTTHSPTTRQGEVRVTPRVDIPVATKNPVIKSPIPGKQEGLENEDSLLNEFTSSSASHVMVSFVVMVMSVLLSSPFCL